jgi:hypothetical protein
VKERNVKRFALLFVLACSALLAGAADAQGWAPAAVGAPATPGVALNAVTTTGASSAINTGGASSVMVQVYSASTSTSTVQIEQSLDGTHWFIVVSISNVASTGVLYAGPAAPWTRVNVAARSGGTISAKVATRTLQADPIAPSWASIAG